MLCENFNLSCVVSLIICGSVRNVLAASLAVTSEDVIKLETFQWSNFSVSLGLEPGDTLNGTLIIEVDAPNIVKVFPQTLEVKTNNLTKWSHIFYVQALRPGTASIKLKVNDKLVSYGAHTVKVDVVKVRMLEEVQWWCTALFFTTGYTSYYPQVFMNNLRGSVYGMDMDYIYYSFIYNFANCIVVSFMPPENGQLGTTIDHTKKITIAWDSKYYSVHNLLLSAVLVAQMFKYPGHKAISEVAKEMATIHLFLGLTAFACAMLGIIQYLYLLYVLRLISIAVYTTQYFPQIHRHILLKSTDGWNIWTTNLRLMSDILFALVVGLNSFNYDDWMLIVTNENFWVCLPVVLQHFIVILQHYIAYNEDLENDEEYCDKGSSAVEHIMAYDEVKYE